ncbi:MAG TPA: S26 family signal peptidase [Actinophytocola sp.]|uniref:S26 family signal peptidase n=1 Tax=Actinophytocola sp. TaxID=1872138 RepID=UPI002DB7B47B|nr:S26 family signal peptidase [Actinophytocola sp.]HEU5470942.1 S26 family signal peptidase [Actinophytocola sp.]
MHESTKALLALASAGAAVGIARVALLVIRVDGTSMLPTFRPGEAVLTLRRRIRPAVRRGDIVVCRRPDARPGPHSYLIKRVVAVAGDPIPDDYDPPPGTGPAAGTIIAAGRVYVRGDNDRSYDSRAFGPIPLDNVIGHVVARLTVA